MCDPHNFELDSWIADNYKNWPCLEPEDETKTDNLVPDTPDWQLELECLRKETDFKTIVPIEKYNGYESKLVDYCQLV